MEFRHDTPDRSSITNRLTDLIIGIKGAGEMASGVACSLYKANIRRIFMMDIESPLAVRRTVSFCESIYSGGCRIEGVEAVLTHDETSIYKAWDHTAVAVIQDPEWNTIAQVKPDVVIDATLAKINLGTGIEEAPLVIGLGPGFEAGKDVHLVIETHRGHDIGRIIEKGSARPNTGVPGNIGGYASERVLRAPSDGIFESQLEIGALVKENQSIGSVGEQPVNATLSGVLRGLIRPGTIVKKGLKLGDIDPRGNADYCYTVSDKARSLGGNVLQAILFKVNRPDGARTSLADAVGLSGRGVISLIGAGGKTSLMFKLAKELARAGRTVLTTTTTKIFLPDKKQSSHMVVNASYESLQSEIGTTVKTMPHFTVGSEVDHDTGKLIGIPPDTVDRLWQQGLFDVIIVEADGSGQQPMKASADHEPVIPLSTSHIVHVTGLDAIGKAVEAAVHRAEIFLENSAIEPGTLLTETHLADNILREVEKADGRGHPLNITAVLNKAETVLQEHQGRRIGYRIKGHACLHRIAVLALKEENPVKFYARI